MFERFAKDAREAVVLAQQEARELGHDEIGPEHVLLGLLRVGTGPAAEALRAHDVDLDDLRARLRSPAEDAALDPEALAAIGIDLDRVREATDAAFGPDALRRGLVRRRRGHIPFTKPAKKALELSLRHALRPKHNHIGTGHILLGVLHDSGNSACHLLWQAGIDLGELRADVTRRITAEAA
nr:Clp protease N-terminal domain-containing protein [Thermomonospora amylolytica]